MRAERWRSARAYAAWLALSVAAVWWCTRSLRDVAVWFVTALVLSLLGART